MEINRTMWELICDRLVCGESLSAICSADRPDGWPCLETVYRWLRDDPQCRADYALARERQADTLADQVLAIADEAQPDAIGVAKLRCDARRWYAGCVRPRQWGNTSALALDANSGAGITVTITRLDSDTAADGTVTTAPAKPSKLP